ncbi:hypothetical protein [Nostoc sp. TCL240-02]|uniref:hypothetical protein n=1 Tax=Nostoc sp. TCL240-02 TaxID=2572090 RepID=UPI00157F813B|nr:hypothetical protein [Nostoc sp. TCL240-02]QKQ73925.1 hypothetical protein FBB35_11775 [Nostoc sp. TCL240-02]
MVFSTVESAHALSLFPTPILATTSYGETFWNNVIAGIGFGAGGAALCVATVVTAPPLAPFVCGGAATAEAVAIWLGTKAILQS